MQFWMGDYGAMLEESEAAKPFVGSFSETGKIRVKVNIAYLMTRIVWRFQAVG